MSGHDHHETPQGDAHGARRVLFVGNPNAGKSTLFNALTGARAQTGNYPGTTVGLTRARLDGDLPTVVEDLPGLYSLAARSPEERVAMDAVLGLNGHETPDLIVLVLDAARLGRSLYLALQVLELGLPVVVALNLMDEARASGSTPDPARVSEALGAPVVPCVARTGEGVARLRELVGEALAQPVASRGPWRPEGPLAADLDRVNAGLVGSLAARRDARPGLSIAIPAWLVLGADGGVAPPEGAPIVLIEEVFAASRAAGRDLQGELIRQRYQWIDARLPELLEASPPSPSVGGAIDRVVMHPVLGSIVFFGVMWTVFEALFAWSSPLVDALDGGVASLGGLVRRAFERVDPAGDWTIVADFVVDGAIGGVGAVLVFLPQIALLFTFLAILEDSGYLARAAQLTDRVLRLAGLPGQAFVPMLSGYACAVPAILATRTLPRFRDRLVTMLVVPLTTCSARLPVYSLVVAALFTEIEPNTGLEMRPLVLMLMYLLSAVTSVVVAVVLSKTVLPGESVASVLELPPWRAPSPRVVIRTVIARCLEFLEEAGGIILRATLVLWALLTFPRQDPAALLAEPASVARIEAGAAPDEVVAELSLSRSFAGQFGRALEPAIAPLGFEWKTGIGLVGAFAAREVFVSTLGVVYGIGDAGEDDTRLHERMRADKRPDGTPVHTPLSGISLLVFFAFAMQCLSTLSVLRRESGGWGWPAFALVYLTVLAWTASFVVYQGGRWLGYS